MKFKINILIIEESDEKVAQIIKTLKQQGFVPFHEHVTSEKEFVYALESNKWDVILTNYSMKKINAKTAITLLAKKELDIPLIVISDAIGEERAVDIMSAGASNCIQWNKLERLTSVIQKEINNHKIRSDGELLFNQIQNAKKEWEATVDAISEIIILTDIEGKIIRVNERAIRKFETTYFDLIGTNIEDLIIDSNIDTEKTLQFYGEIQLPELEGWFEVSSYPIFIDDDLHGLVYLFRDITERKILEERLENFYRLSGFGRLIADIYKQDIYEPLTGINNNILKLKQILENNIYLDELKNITNQIEKYLEFIKTKSKTIIDFADGVARVNHDNDINDIIIETLNIIDNKIESNAEISIRTELQNDIPSLYYDENQMILALFNILQNSIESLPGGGEIYIQTKYSSEKSELIIQIIDNGKGIPEDIVSQVTESFFSLKSPGQSIGCGLTIAKLIIKEYGGSIEVTSNSQAGTSTTISLPVKNNYIKKLR